MPRMLIYACPHSGSSATMSTALDDARLQPPALVVRGNTCQVRLQRQTTPASRVYKRLLPQGSSIYCDAGHPSLRFGRAVETTGSGEKTALLDELALLLRHPDHCHWKRASALASGPGDDATRQIGPLISPQRPDGDARKRPVLPGANEDTLARLASAETVPGDLLSLDWIFEGGDGAVHATRAGGYMETPCLRGGRIVQAAGEPDRDDRRYLVEGHGGWVVCAASDHVAYAVGDWVYYSYVNGQCTSCRWWDALFTLDITLRSGGSHVIPEPSPQPGLGAGQTPEAVILPLVCGGFKAEGPQFAPYAMPKVAANAMGDMLDFCLRKAVVIEVDDQGRLSLELPWGRVDQVPAHYHCPSATDVAGGHAAFRPEDEVLAVSSREQQRVHAVIGFADKLPRPCKEYVVISTGLGHLGGRTFYVVWDVAEARLAEDLPAGPAQENGVVDPSVFPCEREYIAYWLDEGSRLMAPVDAMGNLLEAERVGFMDRAGARYDDQPHPERFGAGQDCQPPNICPEFASLQLGGRCGECEQEKTSANPYSGLDSSTFTKLAEASFDEQTGLQQAHELHTWRDTHPYIQCLRQAAGPHAAYSLRCVWGAFEDVIQVSRVYEAQREVWFDSNLTQNLLTFQETVTDRIAFPGVAHRPAFEWTEVSNVSRPVVDTQGAAPKTWVWNDRDVTVGGFGVRTLNSWLFAYVCIGRRWRVEPYEAPGVKIREPGFEVAIAAGAGRAQEHPVEESPFPLPTNPALEQALEALAQAVFADVDFSNQTHSENLFAWEVRA